MFDKCIVGQRRFREKNIYNKEYKSMSLPFNDVPGFYSFGQTVLTQHVAQGSNVHYV